MEVRIIVETTAEKGESGHTNFAVSVSPAKVMVIWGSGCGMRKTYSGSFREQC